MTGDTLNVLNMECPGGSRTEGMTAEGAPVKERSCGFMVPSPMGVSSGQLMWESAVSSAVSDGSEEEAFPLPEDFVGARVGIRANVRANGDAAHRIECASAGKDGNVLHNTAAYNIR